MLQLVANSIVAAALIVLVGIGFSLIYQAVRFFHFAHATSFLIGAYAYFVAAKHLFLPTPVSIGVAIFYAGLVGAVMEMGIYRPLRRRRAGSLQLLLASIGIMIVAQAAIALGFGSEVRLSRRTAVLEPISLVGISVTYVQIVLVAVAIVTIIVTLCISRMHIIGTQWKAVASDPDLAKAIGVPTDRIILIVICYGSVLAGLAGALHSLDAHLRPSMGLRPLLLGVVAMIIGGSGSIGGLVIAAVGLAVLQQMGAWWLGSQWQDATALALLLFFLYVRPQGLFGKPLRQATA